MNKVNDFIRVIFQLECTLMFIYRSIAYCYSSNMFRLYFTLKFLTYNRNFPNLLFYKRL